jgi:hypothetical protein
LAASARTIASLPSSAPIATTWPFWTFAAKPDGEIGEALEGGLVEGEVRGGRHSRHRSARGLAARRSSDVVDEVEHLLDPRRPPRIRSIEAPGQGRTIRKRCSVPSTRACAETSTRSPGRVHELELAQVDDDVLPVVQAAPGSPRRARAPVARSSSPRMTTTARPSRSEIEIENPVGSNAMLRATLYSAGAS